MKNLFVFIAILFSSMHLFSQCISVELSIFWKRESSPFSLTENDFCVPFLQITYRNNSDEALYFLKVSQSVNNFPEFVRSGTLVNNNPTQYGNYSNTQFLVNLGASPHYLNAWEVIPDTLDPKKEHEIPIINDDLANIYESLSDNYSDSLNEVKTHYTVSDIIPELILDKFKDKFVFLRAGEIYTDTNNLVGFKLLKGCFTFYISPYLPTYVYTTPIWDKNQSKYIETKSVLPKLVGEYKLYSGNFNSNKISLTF